MPSLAQILATVGQGRGLPQRFRPFANQAANEAFLRFAPEWEGLNALREQSAGTMRQGVTQATSAAQLNAALARQGAKDFGGLPANPLPYEGAPGSSAAIAATNRGLTREGTLAMLATAANNAPIAGAQQVRQLTDVHADDLVKINSQRASLGGQVGAFVQGRLGSLIGDDRDARRKVNAQRRTLEQQLDLATQRDETTRRGQDLSHEDRQDSVAQRREAAAQRKREADRKKNKGTLPGGVKLQTPKQHGALKDQVGSTVALVNKQRSLGRSRQEIAQLLLNGRPTSTVDDGKGNKLKVPSLPKVPQLALSAALDLVFDSHISARNVRELHRRGYSVNKLGYSTKPKRPTSVNTGFGGSIPIPS